MEKAQDLQQMLNSIITVSEVESTRYWWFRYGDVCPAVQHRDQ
ncbi:TPA: Rz1 family lipoprotein [Escherichia coli]|nr:Rz1 family lipoprotein [Escherichia coli]MCV7901586.1 Rz1 family lipoprotein [Escherichia coli]